MSFQKFLKELEGWMTDPDGQEHCPNCWLAYLAKFDDDERIKQMVKKDSHPTKTKSIAKVRRASDAWFVICERCGATAWAPYAPGEAPKFK